MSTQRRLTINFNKETVICDGKVYSLSEPTGFSLIGDAWLRAGWDAKYVYSFTWLGRPIIQQPEDMIRIQELIYQIKPDYIIEVGIAHGGSLIYYASLCSLMGKGKVIGIDIDIRPHNRKAIEEHELYKYITMFEGDSIDNAIIEKIKDIIYKNSDNSSGSSNDDSKNSNDSPVIMVILDGDHTKEHVLKELYSYSKFVSINSYIIACDGYIKELVGECRGPRSEENWVYDNPKMAVNEFVKNNPDFILEEPKFLFNEGTVDRWISHWSGGFVKRIK